MLPKYAWYFNNSLEQAWPVWTLKPNDLGLFDVLGNVSNWCQERPKGYPTGKGVDAVDDEEDEPLTGPADRAYRGAAYIRRAANVRSARRFSGSPTEVYTYIGFRPARTLRP